MHVSFQRALLSFLLSSTQSSAIGQFLLLLLLLLLLGSKFPKSGFSSTFLPSFPLSSLFSIKADNGIPSLPLRVLVGARFHCLLTNFFAKSLAKKLKSGGRRKKLFPLLPATRCGQKGKWRNWFVPKRGKEFFRVWAFYVCGRTFAKIMSFTESFIKNFFLPGQIAKCQIKGEHSSCMKLDEIGLHFRSVSPFFFFFWEGNLGNNSMLF